MYKIERQEKILDYINQKGSVSNAELSETFKVSKVTIRTDIEELAIKGYISKTHGGAVGRAIGISTEIPYDIKSESRIKEKKGIAQRAATYIKEGNVIIIDSGSTTFQLVEFLPNNITIITNDILLALEVIKQKKDIRLKTGLELQAKGVPRVSGDDTKPLTIKQQGKEFIEEQLSTVLD